MTNRPILNPAQRVVLTLIANGWTDEAIARRHYVTPRTLLRHIAVIRAKLGAQTRAQAVAAGLVLREIDVHDIELPNRQPA